MDLWLPKADKRQTNMSRYIIWEMGEQALRNKVPTSNLIRVAQPQLRSQILGSAAGYGPGAQQAKVADQHPICCHGRDCVARANEQGFCYL